MTTCNFTFSVSVCLTWLWYALSRWETVSYIPSIKQNNNVHIGNHLYFWKPEKAGERNPTVIFFFLKLFASQGTRILIPYKKPWWLSDIFCNTSAYSVKNLKKGKKRKVCRLFHWPPGLQTATFDIQRCTFSSRGGRVENAHAVGPVYQTGTELDVLTVYREKKMWRRSQDCWGLIECVRWDIARRV